MDLHIFPDPEAMGEAAAALTASLIESSDPERPFFLALSGGSTPEPYHRSLARQPIPWQRVHIFWGDDRFVPTTDEHSNVRMARQTLLDHIDIPAAQVHPIPTHFPDHRAAAAVYEKTIREVMGEGVGYDLAVMGMGQDGHTASLFPGDVFLEDDRLVAPTLAPPGVPIRHRVTATLTLLNLSRHVLYLVAGAEKRALVERVLRDPGCCPEVPAACVRGTQTLRWFVDQAAAP